MESTRLKYGIMRGWSLVQVQIRGRNMVVTEALKDYVNKRMKKLDRFADYFGDVAATMSVVKGAHRIEVTIPVNGMILRAEETSGDMYSSVDLVMDKLEKRIEKYKSKLFKRARPGQEAQAPTPVAVEPEDVLDVVRTKRFAIKPMPVEEAILQMSLLGHSFYVFSNAETDQVNVVYKRKDGLFGLIEPGF